MASITKYETKKGLRYRVDIYGAIDPATGKQKNITKRGFVTQKEASSYAKKAEFDLLRGRKNQLPTKKTFAQVYEEWLPVYQKTVRESTYITTVSRMKHHVLPLLGKYRINKITTDICRNAIAEWEKRTPGSFDLTYQKAVLVFNYAVSREYIDYNPLKKVELRRRDIPDLETYIDDVVWTREELDTFLDACKTKAYRPDIYPLFRLIACSGLRIGEVAALRWEDIDLKKRIISVRGTVTRGFKEDGVHTTEVIGPPKTDASRAQLMIDEETANALAEWKATGLSYPFVFENSKGSFARRPTIRGYMKIMCEIAGVRPIHVHGLRHTFCTLLIQNNVSVKSVQRMMRHANPNVTLSIYAHYQEDELRAASDMIGSIVGDGSTSKSTS